MRIKTITLDDDELPETITVEMTVDEAALIDRMMGALSSATVNAVLGGSRWSTAQREISLALSGMLFNRFWDDGVNDVIPTWPNFNERLKQ